MKYLRFLFIGILFGIIMTKGEVVSWFRMQEMFRFDGFHMYGVIGTAVIVTAIWIFLVKKFNARSIDNTPLKFKIMSLQWTRLLLGGIIFGLGWAMTGACPGPLYVLAGHGHLIILVVIAAALLGTLTYGVLRDKLPH